MTTGYRASEATVGIWRQVLHLFPCGSTNITRYACLSKRWQHKKEKEKRLVICVRSFNFYYFFSFFVIWLHVKMSTCKLHNCSRTYCKISNCWIHWSHKLVNIIVLPLCYRHITSANEICLSVDWKCVPTLTFWLWFVLIPLSSIANAVSRTCCAITLRCYTRFTPCHGIYQLPGHANVDIDLLLFRWRFRYAFTSRTTLSEHAHGISNVDLGL